MQLCTTTILNYTISGIENRFSRPREHITSDVRNNSYVYCMRFIQKMNKIENHYVQFLARNYFYILL